MPDWRALVRAKLAAFAKSAATEIDVTEEIAQHLEDRYGEWRAAGLSEEEALLRAQAELDDESLADELGDVFGRE